MGSYSAPTLQQVAEKALADNTHTSGEVLIGPFKIMNPFVIVKTSPAWDGLIAPQWLDETDTWQNLFTAGATDKTYCGVMDQLVAAVQIASPVQFRVLLDTAPTVGSAVCYLHGLRSPANPLW